MAIIKKQQAQTPNPTPTGQSGGLGAGAEEVKNHSPQVPEVVWNPKTISEGLVPERRQNQNVSERRRDYRRVEDRELISRAYQEAVHIKEQARAQGLADGLNTVGEELQALKAQLDELLVSRSQVLKSVAQDIAPLAVAVAERIIKTEITCDEELILSLVHDTIQKVGRKTKGVLIKVNPDDVPLVKKDVKANPPHGLEAEILVMGDSTIDPGSCILETDSGLIDASLSTRLEILRKLFGYLPIEAPYHHMDEETPLIAAITPTESESIASDPFNTAWLEDDDVHSKREGNP